MKISVEYGTSLLEHDISELLTVGNLNDVDESDIIESIKEAIDINGDIDYLWDEIYDAVSNFDVLPQGEFDYEEDSQKLYQIAKRNLNEVKDKTDILLTQYDDRNSPMKSRKISFFSILEDLLDCDYGDCGWDARLGQYVEERLMKFVELSRWHWGLQKQSGDIIEDVAEWPEPVCYGKSYEWGNENLQPVIWFGLDREKPNAHWILWNREKCKIDNFWFNNESWDILEVLVENLNDSFLIWYTAECGFVTPDMDVLLSDCPVTLKVDELIENTSVKMEEFFVDQWKKRRKH